MKTTRQRKGKTVEAPKKKNESTVCSGVKKSRTRNCGWHQKASGVSEHIFSEEDRVVLPFSAAQVLSKLLSNRGTSQRESTEVIPALDLKTGQLHPSIKIKLQLFPIDERIRIGLEKDGHNPFLELTLRARKKISSVLKHLNSKWGSSTVAQGELMLFPYNIQLEKLSSYRRWTLNDNGITAGDVYSAVERPAVFRLRYGWFSNLDLKTLWVPSTSTPLEVHLEAENEKGCSTTMQVMCDEEKSLDGTCEKDKPIHISESMDAVITEQGEKLKIDNGLARSTVPWDNSLTNLSIGGLLSETSLQGKINNVGAETNGTGTDLQPIQVISDISMGSLLFEASLQGKLKNCDSKENGSKLGLNPPVDNGLWDDSFTTLSIGGLLSEASLLGKFSNCDSKSNGIKSGLQPTLLISDSLDAFIAGHTNSRTQVSKPSLLEKSSILDAEETCHAFSFRKLSSAHKDDMATNESANSGGCSSNGGPKSFKFPRCPEESEMDPLPRSRLYNDESSLGLTGIKWNDSLGPFDLGLSSWQVTGGDGSSMNEFVR